MHGLIFETSICYWQDQPDIFPTLGLVESQPESRPSHVQSIQCRAGFPTQPTDKFPFPIMRSLTNREIFQITHGNRNQPFNTVSEYSSPALWPGALLNCLRTPARLKSRAESCSRLAFHTQSPLQRCKPQLRSTGTCHSHGI